MDDRRNDRNSQYVQNNIVVLFFLCQDRRQEEEEEEEDKTLHYLTKNKLIVVNDQWSRTIRLMITTFDFEFIDRFRVKNELLKSKFFDKMRGYNSSSLLVIVIICTEEKLKIAANHRYQRRLLHTYSIIR